MQAAARLHSLLDKRALDVSEADLAFLKEVVHHYPFFQAARFKYVEVLHSKQSLGFDKELAILAIHTVNRKVLFDIYYGREYEEETDQARKLREAQMSNYQLSGIIESSDSDDPLVEPSGINYQISTPEFDLASEYEAPAPEKIKNKRSLELIDSFLGNAGKVKKPETTSEKPAKEEPNEHNFIPEDLVSETLAKIYIKQNKIEEAIRIYEQLSLLEPEKKPKFAGLIEELKKKLD